MITPPAPSHFGIQLFTLCTSVPEDGSACRFCRWPFALSPSRRPAVSVVLFRLSPFAARLSRLGFCLLPFAFCLSVWAQGTTFTYQGRLNDGASPANGIYDLRFTTYDSTNQPGTVVAGPLTNSAAAVSNGLFLVALDFGGGVFDGTARWLEIAVRTNGGVAFTPLEPRQPITPAPYAITAGQLVSGGLAAGLYGNPVNFSNSANQFTGSFAGNGSALSNVNAATLGGLPAGTFWQTSGNAGLNPGTSFLGTIDFLPLELKVAGMRVLRLEPDPRGDIAGNLIGGSTNNAVEQPRSGGNVISGGGYLSGPNIIHSNSSGVFIGAGSAHQVGPNINDAVIGGGYGNAIRSFDGVIGGGTANMIEADSGYGFIGGGGNNTIQSNSSYAAVGGGSGNTIRSSGGVIGGGNANTLGANAPSSFIGGGLNNNVSGPYSAIGGGLSLAIQTNAWYATVGGGAYHSIGSNSSSTTISGGYANTIGHDTLDAAIGGGSFQSVGTNSYYSTIAGGRVNSVGDNATSAAIGGGMQNAIGTGAGYAAVGGGYFNAISGSFASIPGGYANSAAGPYSLAAGVAAHANHSGAFVWSDASDFSGFASTAPNQFSVRATGGVRFLTGGAGLTVDGQTLGGSGANAVWLTGGNASANPTNGAFLGTTDAQALEFKVAGRRAWRLEPATNADLNYNFAPNVIGGHESNSIAPGIVGATIAGGGRIDGFGQDLTHHITAHHGTIGGGDRNTVAGEDGTVAGGGGNYVGGAYSTAAGGLFNTIATNGFAAAIGGGDFNQATADTATVGGGNNNTASGSGSTVPGGSGNTAAGLNSFAAGRRAKANHDGSFVWADDSDADFASTATKQFAVRAGNGVMIQATNTALDLRGGGAIKVTGAGVGTATPVFTHRATAANISGHITTIDNPTCNGDPNALLLVTHNWSKDTALNPYEPEPVGVWYNGTRWTIFHENTSVAMPAGRAFNVMIVKP